MINFIKRSLLLLFLVWSIPASAVDATLLPNGLQQFFDNNGNPLSSGKVFFYIPATETFKTTWQNAGKSIVNTNPVTLDAAGRAIIYGDGTYRQILKKANGDEVWDALTSSTGTSGGGGTLVGDGNLVGTILPWSSLTAPNQYVFAYGQEISRVTYPEFFTAITYTQIVNCSSGSPTISGLADTTQLPVGATIELACVAPGSTIISKTLTTITASNNSSLSTSASATFFPYGNGNGTTTFNVPDLRGRGISGRDNMGGTIANRLNSTYFASPGTGAIGGAQSKVLISSNLPPYTPSGTVAITDPGHTHTSKQGNSVATYNGASSAPALQSNIADTTGSSTTGVTAAFTGTAQGGTSTAFGIVQPTITLNYVVKITPDVSSSVATGVASLGGMTGVIACGTGILCTGNIVSLTGATSYPVVHPSSGNLACAIGHSLWWQDENICGTGDVWQLTSNDPSAYFTATLTGTATVGDTVSLQFEFAGACVAGPPACKVTYTVVGGDTLQNIANGLVCAIANNTTLFSLNGATCSAGVVGAAGGGYSSGKQIGFVVQATNSVALDFNSAVSMKVTSAVTGAATEIVTLPSNCGTVCVAPLDNNPAIQLVRKAGIAPPSGSVVTAIYSIGATSACPTTSCINYGSITNWVANSTAASLKSAWLLQTPNTAGTMAGGMFFGQGAYSNYGASPFATGFLDDKGAGTLNLGTCLWIDAQIAGYAGNSLCRNAGSGQFIMLSGATDNIIISSANGVGINVAPTGTTFTSNLGGFFAGSQVPTTGAGISLQGSATPNIVARNYGTATNLPLTITALSITLSPALGVGSGGTSLTAGTSGGIPYFNSTSTMASSALLTTNAIVTGGGAGASPVASSLCSISTTVFLCSSSTAQTPTINFTNTTADANSVIVLLDKNRTSGNTSSGDKLGWFLARGWASGAQQTSAGLTFVQDAASSGANIPTRVEIATSNTAGQANQILTFDRNAHVSVTQATAPTITAGCSGAGSGLVGADHYGTVTGSTAAATTCTITFGTAFSVAPHCVASGQTSPLTGAITPTTSTLVVNFGSTANYKFSYVCFGG